MTILEALHSHILNYSDTKAPKHQSTDTLSEVMRSMSDTYYRINEEVLNKEAVEPGQARSEGIS